MSGDRYFEVMNVLYDGQTPMMAMQKTFMEKRMDYSDARECVHVVYEKRGYNPTLEFIEMLTGFDVINLSDRTNLTAYITTIEEAKIHKKQQKRLAQKIRKNLK